MDLELNPDNPLGREMMSNNRPSSLIARLINPAEVADVVTFVVSERASIINGSSIRAEGGLIKTVFSWIIIRASILISSISSPVKTEYAQVKLWLGFSSKLVWYRFEINALYSSSSSGRSG